MIALILIVITGVCPDWISREEIYPFDTEVRYPANGQHYRALYDVPGTITPTTFEWWLPIDGCTDTTEIDTTETDTTNNQKIVEALDRNTSMVATVFQLGYIILGGILMLMGFRDGRRG